MTLVREAGRVRLVECPLCGVDLREEKPARHLADCDAFRERFDMPPNPSSPSTASCDVPPSVIEATKRGLEEAREAGKWIGTPPRGFSSKDGELSVVVEEFRDIQEAIRRVDTRESFTRVADDYDHLPLSTLRQLANDPERRAVYLTGETNDERVRRAIVRCASELELDVTFDAAPASA